MGFFRGPEKITKLQNGGTFVTLPSGSNLLIGGQGYRLNSSLNCNPSSVGLGGLDSGALASNTLYYVYAVVVSNVVYLVCSVSNISPFGYLSYNKIGAFQIDGNSTILNAYFFGDTVDTAVASFTPTGTWVSGNETYSGKWQRIKDKLVTDIEIILNGAPTSAILDMNIHNGLEMDTSKIDLTSGLNVLGSAILSDASAQVYMARTTYASTKKVTPKYFVQANMNWGNVSLNSPFTWGNADVVKINYSVPILGWDKEIDWNNY